MQSTFLNRLLQKRENENESELYCQFCLDIQGICYSERSSTVQQNDSNRTGHR